MRYHGGMTVTTEALREDALREEGLRERKKRRTRAALRRAALSLTVERGLDHVTVDEIAAAAEVSPRTFFNYFASKEEALVGVDPGLVEELADELRARPESEGPVAALRAVLLEVTDPGETFRRWQLRDELVARHPALLPRHLATMERVRTALAAALADRMGIDRLADPTADTVVAAVMAALRAAVAWWQESDGSRPIGTAIDGAFALVSSFDETAVPTDDRNQKESR